MTNSAGVGMEININEQGGSSSQNSCRRDSVGSATLMIKLVALNIPVLVFNGNYADWTSFQDMFV